MTEANTRQQIVEAADRLFYRQGFESTTFSDIADVVKISRGNFYHHFKSKDEILDAVIARRLGHTREMLTEWDRSARSPADRVRAFFEILLRNRDSILRHGCPVGTLTTELAKLQHPSQPAASMLFTLFRTWLRAQFAHMGLPTQADALAMHVLALSQGVAVVANACGDEAFLRHEVERLSHWLEGLVSPSQRAGKPKKGRRE